MNQSNIAGRRAIVLTTSVKTLNFSVMEFLLNGKILYHCGTQKWGEWSIVGSSLNISIENSFQVICEVHENDLIRGLESTSAGIQNEFIALLYNKKDYGDLKANICFLINQFLIPNFFCKDFIVPKNIDIFLTIFVDVNSGIVLHGIYKLLIKYWDIKFRKKGILSRFMKISLNSNWLNKFNNLILNLRFLELSSDEFIERISELNQNSGNLIKCIEQNKSKIDKKSIDNGDFEDIVNSIRETNGKIDEIYKSLNKVNIDALVSYARRSKLINNEYLENYES